MKPVRLSEKVLHIRGGKRKGNVRNMIDLAKAIRYAEKFVSKNKARPVFNYIFIKDGEVISSDTYYEDLLMVYSMLLEKDRKILRITKANSILPEKDMENYFKWNRWAERLGYEEKK